MEVISFPLLLWVVFQIVKHYFSQSEEEVPPTPEQTRKELADFTGRELQQELDRRKKQADDLADYLWQTKNAYNSLKPPHQWPL